MGTEVMRLVYSWIIQRCQMVNVRSGKSGGRPKKSRLAKISIAHSLDMSASTDRVDFFEAWARTSTFDFLE